MSMSVSFRSAGLSSLLAALMGSVFCFPAVAAPSSGGWTTTKVEGGSVPYCAVSRKIDTITLTVGRSVGADSSLAVEFAADTLDPKKAYNVTIKAGKATPIEIEARPLGARTFVFNLDHVIDLKREFSSSPTLELRYAGAQNTLTLGEWAGAARDVEACLASLTPQVPKVSTLGANTPESTPITQAASPAAGKAAAAASQGGRASQQQGAALTKLAPEALLAAVPDSASTLASASESVPAPAKGSPVPAVPVSPSKTKAAAEMAAMAARSERTDMEQNLRRAQTELQDARAELDDLRATRLKDMQATMDQTKRMQEGAQKIAALEAENKVLSAQMAADKKDLMEKLAAEQKQQAAKGALADETLVRQVAELQARNESLSRELSSARMAAEAGTKKAEKSVAEIAQKLKNDTDAQKEKTELEARIAALQVDLAAQQKMRTDLSAMQIERDTLKSKLDEAIRASATNPALADKIKELESALARRDADNKELQQKLASAAAASNAASKGADTSRDLRARLDALVSENVRIKADLAAVKSSPSDVKVSVAAERPLRLQLRDLKKDNDILMARQRELESQIEKQRRGIEDKDAKVMGGDEEMERALRRFEEAEREVQRLSLTLREERAKCTADKREIEYMLFDPKIAKEGQIALLNSLEDQIAALKAGQKAAPAVTAEPAACAVPSAAPTPSQNTAADDAARAAAKAEMDKKLADLRVENEKLRADLAVAQNIASQMKVVASTPPTRSAAPVSGPAAKSDASAAANVAPADTIVWNGSAAGAEGAHAAAMKKLAAENAALKSDLQGVQGQIAQAKMKTAVDKTLPVAADKADKKADVPARDLAQNLLDADMRAPSPSVPSVPSDKGQQNAPDAKMASAATSSTPAPAVSVSPKQTASADLKVPPVAAAREVSPPVPAVEGSSSSASNKGPRTVSVEPMPAPAPQRISPADKGAAPLSVADVGLVREAPRPASMPPVAMAKAPVQASSSSSNPAASPASASAVPAVVRESLPAAAASASASASALLPPPAPVAATPSALSAPAPVQDVGAVALQALLQNIGLQTAAPPARLSQNPFGAGGAYRWQTDMLVGLASHRPGVSASGFEGVWSEVLQKLKSVCKGDFAAQVALSHAGAPLTYTAYDVACISGANSTSAAVLFYHIGSDFYMISHESAPDDMGKAMDVRDDLIRALSEQR